MLFEKSRIKMRRKREKARIKRGLIKASNCLNTTNKLDSNKITRI